jgi:hypothetical protein
VGGAVVVTTVEVVSGGALDDAGDTEGLLSDEQATNATAPRSSAATVRACLL